MHPVAVSACLAKQVAQTGPLVSNPLAQLVTVLLPPIQVETGSAPTS